MVGVDLDSMVLRGPTLQVVQKCLCALKALLVTLVVDFASSDIFEDHVHSQPPFWSGTNSAGLALHHPLRRLDGI